MIRTREHAKSWGGYAAFPTRIVSVDCNWPECSVPEGILERVVEHVNADCEKRLDGIPVPAFAVGTPVCLELTILALIPRFGNVAWQAASALRALTNITLSS